MSVKELWSLNGKVRLIVLTQDDRFERTLRIFVTFGNLVFDPITFWPTTPARRLPFP